MPGFGKVSAPLSGQLPGSDGFTVDRGDLVGFRRANTLLQPKLDRPAGMEHRTGRRRLHGGGDRYRRRRDFRRKRGRNLDLDIPQPEHGAIAFRVDADPQHLRLIERPPGQVDFDRSPLRAWNRERDLGPRGDLHERAIDSVPHGRRIRLNLKPQLSGMGERFGCLQVDLRVNPEIGRAVPFGGTADRPSPPGRTPRSSGRTCSGGTGRPGSARPTTAGPPENPPAAGRRKLPAEELKSSVSSFASKLHQVFHQ